MLIRCYIICRLTIMGLVCHFIFVYCALCIFVTFTQPCSRSNCTFVPLRCSLFVFNWCLQCCSPLFTFSINLIVTNTITHANLHPLTEVLPFSLEMFRYLQWTWILRIFPESPKIIARLGQATVQERMKESSTYAIPCMTSYSLQSREVCVSC